MPTFKKKGFTLIEMLVVIAIIGILASLLMPSLRKAMETARGIDCSNRQRQLLLSTLQYAEEYNGYGPTRRYSTASSVPPELRGKQWQHILWPYTSDANRPKTWYPYKPAYCYDFIMNCPSAVNGISNSMIYGRTYALNCYLKKANGSMVYQGQNNASAAFFKFKSPSKTMVFGEFWQYFSPWKVWLWGSNFDNPITHSSTKIPDHHNGSSNIVFYDGHAEVYGEFDWPSKADGTYVNQWYQGGVFWHGF